MRDLNHDFKLLCQRNCDGSMATQHDREVALGLMADQLHWGGSINRAQHIGTWALAALALQSVRLTVAGDPN